MNKTRGRQGKELDKDGRRLINVNTEHNIHVSLM